jgi:hypothetical protein
LPDQALVLDDANFPALTSPGKPASAAQPPPPAEPKQAAPLARPVSPTSPLGSPDVLLPPATPAHAIGDGSARDSCTGSVASSDERCASAIEDEPFTGKPAAAAPANDSAEEEQPLHEEGMPLQTGAKAPGTEDLAHANGDAPEQPAAGIEQGAEAAGEDGSVTNAAGVQPGSRPFQPASAQQARPNIHSLGPNLECCYLDMLCGASGTHALMVGLCGAPNQASAWARKDKLVFAAEDDGPPGLPPPKPMARSVRSPSCPL